MGSPYRFQENLYTTCAIRAKLKTINFNVIKAKYKIDKIYLIKVKYELLVVANFRFHFYVQLLFLILHFAIFWNTVIYVIKANYKITKICLIKGKHKFLFFANLKLYFYAQLLFLKTFFHFWGYSYLCYKGEIRN